MQKEIECSVLDSEKNHNSCGVESSRESQTSNRKYRILLSHVPDEQKKRFQYSKCLFLISVGQHYHEGSKLEAALKCINKHFKEIVIVVGDTIQRYTHAAYHNQAPDELLDFAESEGDKWLERNGSIIEESLTKPYKIFRWEHYRKHPKFSHYFSIIEDTYESGDTEYQVAFEKDTKDFLQRAGRGELSLSPDRVALCLQYLKEECTCMCLWTEENCEFLAYPYGINNVFRVTYKKFIEGAYNGIMREIPYSIKKNYEGT